MMEMFNCRFKLDGSEPSEVLQHLQKDINIAASKGEIETVQRLLRDGANANYKDVDGKTPLHYAISNGHIDVVNILLTNGANVNQVTNEGKTPLHTATSKGYKEIVEVLLQHTSQDELNKFVNAKTTSSDTTPLHLAAKGDFLEVVKSLLKHGAIYKFENKQGKTPFDLSKHQNVTNLLKLIEELFIDVKNGNVESISKLRAVKPDEFLAITNARNNQGHTLLQIAIVNKHMNIASKLLKMLKEPAKVQLRIISECELDRLEKLKSAAEVHVRFSELYLPMLQSMSQPYDSEKNTFPWKTLKEGSYYLGNAYNLVKVYKDCVAGLIDNKNIQSVNDTLVALEFDPEHITSGYTDEAYGGMAECFVSKGQCTKYYNLLHSELKEDVRSFIKMVELNIDIPVKRFLESINQRLQSAFSERLLEAIENDNLLAIENFIKRGVIANFKDTDGRTPLHHAVNNGNIDVISTLLSNGADVTQITNEGITPLHIASSKGYREVVEVLLQYVSSDELNEFIDARTTSGGATSLHIAAEIGFLQVVTYLLKLGATYNIENKEGKTPIDLSKDQKVINLLKFIEELCREIKNGNVDSISKLRAVKPDEFLAITNARNKQGNTLLQIAIANKHKHIANKLSEMQKEPYQYIPECELDQLEKLKSAAEVHVRFSELYLPMLQSMSQPYDSEKNTFPWKTLKEGSYYLGNAYNLVKVYKDCVAGLIDNKSIQSVNDTLVALEFDPEHITSGYTDEAYGGVAKCFVSKGQGTKYYNLLHSELKEDVRSFIEMVELNIDIPVKRFLESIKQRLQSAFSERLLEAIENDNLLAIENFIKRGVIANFKDTDGRTPLHHAVNNGNIDVISTLLSNGADVTQITNEGITPLHIASSKGYREVVEVLLQYVSSNELNEFIDARTTSGGATSLHIAAEIGFLQVVTYLLRLGATYNIENKEGKTPIDLSKDQKVINLLKFIEELCREIKNGNVDSISKLRAVKPDEFLAITNARNKQGNTLLQIAIANKHKHIANKLSEMQKEPYQYIPECELDQLEKLKSAAEIHVRFSELYLPMLQSMSQPYDSEKNTFPWKTLKKGSYYLGNAYNLVKVYKDCVAGLIDNKSIQSVNDTLVALEFDPEHITSGYTDEAYGGMAKCFVSKGQGTKYYNLLHSELKEDVRSFIEMVELNIDIPVKRFLESIKQRLQSAF